MKKKVAIIGTNGLPAKYGGFETLADYLVQYLSNEFQFYIYCSKNNSTDNLKEYNGTKLITLPLNANGSQSIIYDIVSIIHSLFYADTLVVLGTPGAIIFPLLKLFDKKVVVNFGGLEWKREKWPILIQRYLKFTERLAVKFSDVVVADNQAFIDYILIEYKVKAILIEYGGDHVLTSFDNEKLINKYPFVKENYFISVSRAQIDNNIHLLLEAYEKSNTKSLLVIISNWDFSDYGRQLKTKYSNHDNIILLDAIYDQKEIDFLRNNAKLYIHTHSFCGTAPSLVEAMNLGLPVICFNVDTNRYTTEDKAVGYFKNSGELSRLLSTLTDAELKTNADSMLEIAKHKYSWSIITKKYAQLF